MQGHRAVDDSIREIAFQHIFNVVLPRRRESVGGPHAVPDRLSRCCPMGGRPPLLSPCPHSLLIVNRCCDLSSVSGNTTHNHGPSIFGPPFGNPGLPCQRRFIFSRIPSKGEKSEISLLLTASHFKFVNPASGDTSDILLCSRFRRFNPVNAARGDIFDIPLPTRYSSFKPVKPARGVRSDRSASQISTFSSFVNPTRGDKSDNGIAP